MQLLSDIPTSVLAEEIQRRTTASIVSYVEEAPAGSTSEPVHVFLIAGSPRLKLYLAADIARQVYNEVSPELPAEEIDDIIADAATADVDTPPDDERNYGTMFPDAQAG